VSDAEATTGMSRRDAVAALAALTAGTVMMPTSAQATHATQVMQRRVIDGFAPKIYTPHEWELVRMLVDYIIPKDARSGAATDAKVPEFMDTMLDLEPNMRTAHRGGLAWLDHEASERFGTTFVASTDPQRRLLLDDIAFPARAKPEFSHGVAWFSSFRDFTATGFWTSEIGVTDIGYQGNTPVMSWDGCPTENYARLGATKE
jgi:hypothetical protein